MKGRPRRLFVLLGVALSLYALTRVGALSAALLQRALANLFHRPAYVGEVRFHLYPLEAEVLDLRVAGKTPADPPFLYVPRLVAAPSLAPLWGRTLLFRRLELERPTVRINAYPQGGDDIPKVGGGQGGGLAVRIRRLTLVRGEFILNHARVPLDLDLPDFGGRLLGGREGLLRGRISFKPGRVQFGDASPAFPAGTDIDLAIQGAQVTVESAHLRAEQTDIAYSGGILLRGRPQGLFQLNGRVNLGLLDRHVFHTGFGMQGDAHYTGTLQVDGPQLRIQGRLAGAKGVFDAVAVPRYEGRVSRDEKGVHIRDLAVETLGGRARFDIEIPPGKSTATLQAALEQVDAEGALQAVFDIGSAGVGSAATGEVRIAWPRGRIRELSGKIALDLAARSDGRTPLLGRFEWSARDGAQTIEKADLKTPATWARLLGRIERDDTADLAVDAESADLAQSDDLLMRLRRALGTRDAALVGVGGSGVFHGRWRRTLQLPLFEGRFSGRELGYLGVDWGAAEWAGSLDALVVRSHSLVLRRPGGELWLDGRSETGELGGRDGVDVRVRFKNWPAADFVTAFEWDLAFDGFLSGEAEITGSRSRPFGSMHVVGGGAYYGIPFSDLEVRARLKGLSAEATLGRATVGGGRLAFEGELTTLDPGSEEVVYDGRVRLEGVDIAEVLPPLAKDVRWGGRVSGELELHGPLECPVLAARFRSPRLFVADEGFGAVEATLEARGDGQVTIAARASSPRLDGTLSGSVAAAAPYDATLRIRLRDSSLDPYLRALFPALPGTVGILASGEADLRGPLAEPLKLAAFGVAQSFELRLPEYPIRSREPVRLGFEQGRLRLEEIRLSGEGTDLAASGSASLGPSGPLAVSLRGEADLRALSAVTQRLRGRGAARLAMSVGGTRAAPQVEGRLELEGAGIRVRGFPHGVEDVRGSVEFSESAAHFSGVSGSLGGGELTLEGQAAYGQGRLGSFEVLAVGHGLGLRYPEGLRSVVDAELRAFGDAAGQWITGTVDVRQASWTRRYDLASELLAARAAPRPMVSRRSGLRYDVKVRIPGTLSIDNNLAMLEARAELQLQGGYENPVILGHAEIEKGRVYFQGNTYVIRRGSIDFTNPRQVDPLFDIEAETRVRSYRVTLKLNGTLSRVYPSLSSDPPLSAVQILSLLAGADESTVASLTQAQLEQGRLAATGAASLAAGRIAEEVGLERGAERLFGLNRFSIDPSVVRGGVTNPTARLTVGRRLSSGLSVLYSVDLRGSDEQLLSLEYTLSDRLSLLITQAQPGGFGFDLRLRHAGR